MTIPQIFVIAVLVVPLVFVFANKLREDVAALLMAALLGLAQLAGMAVLGPANTPREAVRALEGFAEPEVITLLSLFVLTYCLDKFGITRWLAQKMLAVGGQSETRLIVLFSVAGALLSLFMNTLAAGALLLPSALDASRRTHIKPSKLLIPIAYGTMLGGAATYFTTANIIVSSLLTQANPPQAPLGVLSFTPTGGVVAIAGLLFLAIFGKRLLPDREPPAVRLNVSGDDLTNIYQIQERLWEAEVKPKSPLVGRTLLDARIGESLGIAVLGARSDGRVTSIYDGGYKIAQGDSLLVVGREERVRQLEQNGLAVHPSTARGPIGSHDSVLVEAVVPPRSGVEDKSLKEIAFRSQYGFTAVALWRDNRSYRTDVATFKLHTGDSLLMLGSRERLSKLRNQRDFVVVETANPDDRPDKPRALLTLAIVVGVLAATIAGLRVEFATLTGMVLALLVGLISADEAYGVIKWRAIFLVAGTLSISLAMVQTGLAGAVGALVVNTVSTLGPMGLVAGTYLLSAALTQVMGGQISPLVVGPIVISAAIHLGINPQAIAVVTAIAGSVSFITPLSHPVNILMIAPANYRFSDFVKSGWALTIVCFIALMAAVPLFWRLR